MYETVRKHHTYRLILVLFIMIFQPVNSSCPNYSVKKIKIYSEFSKGFVRVENNKVTAAQCRNNNCGSKEYVFYKVTLGKHMLLYHIKSGKFICWNRYFNNLIARRNISNIALCQFQEDKSKNKYLGGHSSRIYSIDRENRQVEMRFTKPGAFARPQRIRKCVKRKGLDINPHWNANRFIKLDPATITEDSDEMNAYKNLTTTCANPDFLLNNAGCKSELDIFCKQMQNQSRNGHCVIDDIANFCSNNKINVTGCNAEP